MKKWYKLDNVGKFYASTSNSIIPKVFRYSAYLYDEIDETILQTSLNQTIKLFPNFNVNLKKGLFWYYLDETLKPNKITKENLPVCFKLYNNSDDYLYRVSYYKKKINLEVSHILSDGRGSAEFFKLLLTNYITNKYKLKNKLNTQNKSLLEKSEDSFLKYYKQVKNIKSDNSKTFHYKGKKLRNQTKYLECFMNANDIVDLAHKYNTTVTALLVAVLIYSFKDELKLSDLNKTIKIDLPVDLRNFYKSSSSMNFFGLTTIKYQFNSLDDELEKIIKSVNESFKNNITPEKLSKRANLMVSFEKNFFCRFSPIFLKNIVLNIADKISIQSSTSCLSNIGIINLDKDIEERIDAISVLTSTNTFQFSICTLKDKLCIGISSNYVNNDVIKNFCLFFANHTKMQINVSEVK